MNLNCFNNRDDIKWSHPEIQAAYEGAAQPSGFAETMFNPEIPFEERKEICRKTLAEFDELYPPRDASRTKNYQVEGCPEEPDAPVFEITVSQPTTTKKKKLPCILCIPCGGLAMCMKSFDPIEILADAHKCVSATFEYRTCFEGGGYPQTINDCHAAYKFICDHAEELNVDPDKIVLYGDSSGGHLALALCHRLKRYGYKPRGCEVWAPIVDDRTVYPSSKIKSAAWAGEQVYASCQQWLGKNSNPAFVPAEAYANHATVEECVGLPPTVIHTFVNDACFDPCLQYASKLGEAGVYVSIHAWGGSNHDALVTSGDVYAADPDVKYPKVFKTVTDADFEDFLRYDLRRPWTVEEAAK